MDGTEQGKDPQEIVNSQPAPATETGTPTETPQYTQAQVDAMLQADRVARGRTDAEIKRAKEAAETARKDAETAIQRQRQAELEANRDDKEALDAIRERHRREDAETRAQIAEAKAREIEAERTMDRISSLAEKTGVDVDKLLNLSKGDYELAKELADVLPKSTATHAQPQPNPQQSANQPQRMNVISGATGGVTGGRKPTAEELSTSTPMQTQAKVNSGEWVIPGWSKS